MIQIQKLTGLLVISCLSGFEIQADAIAADKSKAAAKSHKNIVNRGSNVLLIKKGKMIFEANQCLDCHKLNGRGCVDGLSLDDIGDRRSKEFLNAQITDPEKHIAQMKSCDPSLMTTPNLSGDEVDAVVAFLRSLKKKSAVKSRQQMTQEKRH